MSLEELEELRVERDVLLMSLEDLEREHDAGDLADDDYTSLRDRYTARAAEVIRAIDRSDDAATDRDGRAASGRAGNASPSSVPASPSSVPASPSSLPSSPSSLPRRLARRRWTAAVVAVLVSVIVLSIVLVVRGTSPRLPGETVSGSVSLNRQQQTSRTLAQAETLESEGDASEALKLYHQVLEQDPTQDDALAESGWLEFEAGVQAKDADLVSEGQSEEQKAERDDPSAFGPHLYLGSMLLVEGDDKAAVSEYRQFLANSPPDSVVESAEPFVDRAFEGAGVPPPDLPGGS